MEQAPRASVVIPVRNGCAVLPQQLRAIAGQTIADQLQVVVVDDASTDDTAAIADRWASEHPQLALHIVRRPSRGGPNASRNDGIRHATAPYVLLCDGDDVAAPDWAERLVSALEGQPGERVLVTGRCVALEDEQPAGDTLHGAVSVQGIQYMLGGNGGFARQLAYDIGGFDEQILAGGTEIDFCFRAFDAGARLVYLEDAIIGYRIPSSARGLVARQLRRSRGNVYLGRRHGTRAGTGRAVDVFVNPWRLALGTVRLAVRGETAAHAVPSMLGRAIGTSFWGAVFRVRTPPQRLGLAEQVDQAARCRSSGAAS